MKTDNDIIIAAGCLLKSDAYDFYSVTFEIFENWRRKNSLHTEQEFTCQRKQTITY